MISTAYRFVFVHVPKTAGNAIHHALNGFEEARTVQTEPHHDGVHRFEMEQEVGGVLLFKHSGVRQFRRALGEKAFAGFHKFAVTRDPFDRMLSIYFHRQNKHVAGSGVEPASTVDEVAFVEFVKAALPIEHYVCPDKQCDDLLAEAEIDDFLRFDRLQADFDALADRISVPRSALPMRNPGARPEYVTWSKAMIEAVAERCAAEIAAFGYRAPA